MSGRRALLVLPLAAVLLAGCGQDPAAERRAAVAALTEAVNARDAGAVRERAQGLVEVVEAQRAEADVPADEAERLIALARSVHEGADLVDEALIARREDEVAAQPSQEPEREEDEQQEADEEQVEEEDEDAKKGKGGGKKG